MTGTNTFTSTDLQYTIPEIWSPKIEREFQANLLAADFFTDFSDLLVGGGDTLHVPGIYTNQFTSSAKSNGSEVTLVSPAQTEVQLAVNTWRHVAYLIEDLELKQMLQSARIPSEYASQAAYVIAKDLDSAIFSNYISLSQSVNDTLTDVSDADIRTAIESVVDGDVPMDELAFFFHPTVIWHDLMAIAKYTNVYQAGSNAGNGNAGPVTTGAFGGTKLSRSMQGILYGIPVYQTTQVTTLGTTSYVNLLAHPKTFMYAVQPLGGGRVRTQADYKLENLGMLWVTDIAYGTGELRDETACLIKSRQTGIVS